MCSNTEVMKSKWYKENNQMETLNMKYVIIKITFLLDDSDNK